MLCRVAEMKGQEQQSGPLPATVLYVAKAVRVRETKLVRRVQTCYYNVAP